MPLYCHSWPLTLIGRLQHYIIGKSGLNGKGIGAPLKQLLNYSVATRELFYENKQLGSFFLSKNNFTALVVQSCRNAEQSRVALKIHPKSKYDNNASSTDATTDHNSLMGENVFHVEVDEAGDVRDAGSEEGFVLSLQERYP